jgi:hypothetical protein
MDWIVHRCGCFVHCSFLSTTTDTGKHINKSCGGFFLLFLGYLVYSVHITTYEERNKMRYGV